MTLILALLYPLAVQYKRGGWWLLVAPVTFAALIIDIWCNYTELALITLDFPARGEWTFSTRLQRLQYYHGWRGTFARACRDYCNYFDKDHVNGRANSI